MYLTGLFQNLHFGYNKHSNLSFMSGRGSAPYGLYREAPPRIMYLNFRPQVYERVIEVSLVEVYVK